MKGELMLLLIVLFLSFSGCSKALGLGYNKGYCEENGANLGDSGVCWSPWVILHNKKQANQMAYSGDNKCGRK